MKQVTMAQAMRGVGDRPVLPDAVADALVASGEAVSAEPWPEARPAQQARKPRREVARPARAAGVLDKRIAE